MVSGTSGDAGFGSIASINASSAAGIGMVITSMAGCCPAALPFETNADSIAGNVDAVMPPKVPGACCVSALQAVSIGAAMFIHADVMVPSAIAPCIIEVHCFRSMNGPAGIPGQAGADMPGQNENCGGIAAARGMPNQFVGAPQIGAGIPIGPPPNMEFDVKAVGQLKAWLQICA